MAVREGVKVAAAVVSKRALWGVGVALKLFAVGVVGGPATIEGMGVCRAAENGGFVGG